MSCVRVCVACSDRPARSGVDSAVLAKVTDAAAKVPTLANRLTRIKAALDESDSTQPISFFMIKLALAVLDGAGARLALCAGQHV